MLSNKEAEVIHELHKEQLLVIEFYNILIPPIFAGYIIAFICFVSLKTSESKDLEEFLMTIQLLSETCHRMGVIQSPTFCSIFYIRLAYQYLLDNKIVAEVPLFIANRIRKHFIVENRLKLKALVKILRSDFLWEENYMIVRRVFEEKFMTKREVESRQKL
jgi:hypothetical protein